MVPMIIFRPLSAPPSTDERDRVMPPFTRTWRDAQALLLTETRHIIADQHRDRPFVIVEIDTDPASFRLDGKPRADAKIGDPVAVNIESRFGPLRYECSTYTGGRWRGGSLTGWRSNVYAIALALEALRKVERYGVGGTGEQYQGWTAIGPAAPSSPTTERAAAEALLARWRHDDDDRTVSAEVLYRRAVRDVHPDLGGDADQFRAVYAAYQLLKGLS